MTIMLGSPIFSFGNTICLYHFDFYHYLKKYLYMF